MIDYSDLIIRWTFGETKQRPTSLQAYDMLECSLLFALKLFPKAEMYVVHNSLKNENTLNKLKHISKSKAILIEAEKEWGNSNKNSFWKYVPLRINSDKYELVLDSDVVFWQVPEIINKWLKSTGVLINTDWNGRNYGNYNEVINDGYNLNAGIIGYPPHYSFNLPDINKLSDTFLSEQGFIVEKLTKSNKELFIIPKNEIFQSNAEEFIDLKYEGLMTNFSGGHFCGCNYCHYAHWDKYYKNEIWNLYNETSKSNTSIKNFRDISTYNSRLKKGKIFRSSALCININQHDLETILQLNDITTLIDLRAGRELAEFNYTKAIFEKYKVTHAPFDPWNQSIEFQNTHNTGTNTEIAYYFFSIECKPSIKIVIESILNSKGATNIHCHAGKDRTGIIITLFHLLSGASKETILLDYLASEMDTNESYIQILLNIVSEHNGVIEYLKSCDLSVNQIESLKSKILI